MFGLWLPILVCTTPGIWGGQPQESDPDGRAIGINPPGNVLSAAGTCEAEGEVGQCMMTWQCMQQGGRHARLCQNRHLFGTCCILSTNETTEWVVDKELGSAPIRASSKIEDLDQIAEFIADFASGILSSSFENGLKTNLKGATEKPKEPEQPEQPKRLGNQKNKPNKNKGLIAVDPLRTGEGCGRTKISIPEGRIVNGTDVAFGEFPWQVSLRAGNLGSSYFSHHCGGTMITKTWVATAAHCLHFIPSIEMLKVRIGEHDLAKEDEKYPYVERTVKRKVTHPKFDFPTFKYDIALLELNKPVPDQPNIGSICLPGSDNNLNGLKGWATGWGRLQDEGRLPTVLQKVPLTIMKNKECKASFKVAGQNEAIPKIFLCAADDGRDACSGDSGGPLQVQDTSGQWFLGGIVSWGIGCARPNHPGVYTRISKFMPFIQKTVFKHS